MFGKKKRAQLYGQQKFRRSITLVQVVGPCIFFISIISAYTQEAFVFSHGPLTFSWDTNPPEEQVAGYVLYYATESTTYRMDVKHTNVAEVIPPISDAAFRFWSAAYNQAGLESLPSAPVVVRSQEGTNQCPTVSELVDQVVVEGFPTEPMEFDVHDLETPASELHLTAASSNSNLVRSANILLEGTGERRTMRVVSEPGATGTTEITLTASDVQGASVTRRFTCTVEKRPTLDSLAPVVLAVGTPAHLITMTGISPGVDGHNLRLSAWSSNPTLIPDPEIFYNSPNSSGWIMLRPQRDVVGQAVITVMVEEPGRVNGFRLQTFFVTIRNSLPQITGLPNQVLMEDGPSVMVPFYVVDAETPPEKLSMWARSSNPAVVSTTNLLVRGSGGNRTLTVQPNRNQFGAVVVTLTVMDQHGGQSFRNFLVTVAPVNDPPEIAPIEDIVMESDTARVTVTGINSGAANELQTLSVSAVSDRPELVPDPTIEYLTPEPVASLLLSHVAGRSGTATITVTVSDGQAQTSRSFRVMVLGPNNPPTLSGLPRELTAVTGSFLEIPFSIYDDDSRLSSLTLELASSDPQLLPTELMFLEGNGAERVLYILPMPGLTGTGWVAVVLSDETSTVVEFITINVVP